MNKPKHFKPKSKKLHKDRYKQHINAHSASEKCDVVGEDIITFEADTVPTAKTYSSKSMLQGEYPIPKPEQIRSERSIGKQTGFKYENTDSYSYSGIQYSASSEPYYDKPLFFEVASADADADVEDS